MERWWTGWDWKGIVEKIAAGIIGAGVLGAITLAWSWGSGGGLLRALGGITRADVEAEITDRLRVFAETLKVKTNQRTEYLTIVDTNTSEATGGGGASRNYSIEILHFLKEKCDGKPVCYIDTTDAAFEKVVPWSGLLDISYDCGVQQMPTVKVTDRPIIRLSCPETVNP